MVHHPDPFVESDRLIGIERNVAAIARHLGVLERPPIGADPEPDDVDVMTAAAKVGISPLAAAPPIVEWQDAANRMALAASLLSAVEAIKASGGAVQIAGVRIEPCDTTGATETTRHRDHLAEAFATAGAQLEAGEASDGFHTHNELYAYRRVYNAALFNEWACTGEHEVVKSWKHSDGELAFGGGWFIVVATLPTGQISNHYQAEHWPLFDVPAVELPPPFDGHTPAEALARLQALVEQEADRG